MKYIKFLESINPSKVKNDKDSFFSVYNDERGICFLGRKYPFYLDLAEKKGLKIIEIPKDTKDDPISYIIYNKEKEKEAKELQNIALKYDGYLSYKATAEETYKIGILLEYDEELVKKHIKSKPRYKNDPFLKHLKTFENFNDNERSLENTPIDPKLKSQVTKYVEDQLGSQNFHEIFDIIGIDMPQTLEGDEFEEKMDLAREKAIDYFMRNPELMQIDGPTEFRTFYTGGGDDVVPRTNNIGGVIN